MTSIPRRLLEQMQVDKKYNLSPEQVIELCKNFQPDYAAEVMIEMGHTNAEIKEATKLNGCSISWMRVRYLTPPPKAELEFRHAEINKEFVHVTTKLERQFCQLFRCGIYHKDYQRTVSRIDAG